VRDILIEHMPYAACVKKFAMKILPQLKPEYPRLLENGDFFLENFKI